MSYRLHDHDPRMAQVYRTDLLGEEAHLTPHFALIELACNDGTPMVLVHPSLLVALELIRHAIGPLIVRSGYRTAAYNETIGGAENSYHMTGMAADLASRSATPEAIGDAARALDVGGLKVYDGFVHVDVGPRRRW
jgi:uncharacterized protein YcbK (DUF882 family)